jgi:UDP-N-acetylmuramoyl-L-alanyl-D-glutamate--2,6-diaminopimelate ligase
VNQGVTPDHPLRLVDLVRELGPSAVLDGDGNVEVSGIRHDSRSVTRGDVFVARRGARADGAAHVADARARGAACVLAGRGVVDAGAAKLPVISVDDAMEGLALAAAAIYGHPSFALDVVGVTGTNGKTTTTHIVRAGVDAAVGRPSCGIIGTVVHGFGAAMSTAAHTTPEADDLQRALLVMKRDGASHVAMEVSSIALAVGRTRSVRFRVAAFTNLTRDHLDFHGTMDSYGEAKAKLFLDYGPGTSVVCVDHDFGRSLASRIPGPTLRVSALAASNADVRPTRVAMTAAGMEGELVTPAGVHAFASPLVGAHNLENLVVAVGCVCALDLDVGRALAGISSSIGAPGRLERVSTPDDDITVLVDYAHTPDALERVLDAVRHVTAGRIVCVFGCGGDRDVEKRGPMGASVASRADVAIITSDNPRSEDPAAIAGPIVAAVRRAMNSVDGTDLARVSGYLVELDRGRAIELAVGSARPSDVVLIAGKGHEDYQLIGTEKRHFDDREQARAALSRRRATAQ